MKLTILGMWTYFNKIILDFQFAKWIKTHSIEDLEKRLLKMGCTSVHAHDSTIFTTPNRKGKIVITEDEIIINPRIKG
jgi:hypothetical protein